MLKVKQEWELESTITIVQAIQKSKWKFFQGTLVYSWGGRCLHDLNIGSMKAETTFVIVATASPAPSIDRVPNAWYKHSDVVNEFEKKILSRIIRD